MDDKAQRICEAEAKVAKLRENARTAQREGAGTHRNAGDAGRVAALWIEAKRELAKLRGES